MSDTNQSNKSEKKLSTPVVSQKNVTNDSARSNQDDDISVVDEEQVAVDTNDNTADSTKVLATPTPATETARDSFIQSTRNHLDSERSPRFEDELGSPGGNKPVRRFSINDNSSSASKTEYQGKGVVITDKGVKIDHRDTSTINKITGMNSEHYYSKEETIAFSTHINNCLGDDPLLARHFPLDVETEDIFQKLGDGLILMRLINSAHPGTIDEKKINKQANMSIYQKQENLNIIVPAAKRIGAQIVNIGGQDIISGR